MVFGFARAFNQDIGGWAVHNGWYLYEMFRGASAFDQDIRDEFDPTTMSGCSPWP